MRSLEIGHASGFDEPETTPPTRRLGIEALQHARDTRERPGTVARRCGAVSRSRSRTSAPIDPWFLAQIEEIVAGREGAAHLAARRSSERRDWLMRRAKRTGFSDRALARALRRPRGRACARCARRSASPGLQAVDTCAAEFEAHTPYLYSTYEDECEASDHGPPQDHDPGRRAEPHRPGDRVRLLLRVHAAFALRDAGYETIMVNCNPETVSTDYDTSDRLFFEPLTGARGRARHRRASRKPRASSCSSAARPRSTSRRPSSRTAGAPIIGTSPESIDRAEDRERFGEAFLRRSSASASRPTASRRSLGRGLRGRAPIGYPVLVRPSYVGPSTRRRRSPVLLDEFLEDAIEVDVDACQRRHRTWSSPGSWSTSRRPGCTRATRAARCRRSTCPRRCSTRSARRPARSRCAWVSSA